MTFPPYCLDYEAMLTAADWAVQPLCRACMQRNYDEALAMAKPEIERLMVENHYIRWGQFWTEDDWEWLHPWEVVDWCLDV
jgi:hypothetical protein